MAQNVGRASGLESADTETFLVQIAKECHARGWALGTSGNFSAVVRREPLLLTITGRGLHKGTLSQDNFVSVDANGTVVQGTGYPSAETALHLLLANVRRAAAVLHTHSAWSTIISDLDAKAGGLWLEGYEMLKGLEGVKSHNHREWLPIIENDQDMTRLAGVAAAKLDEYPGVHGLLLRRHGLYTWGESLEQAKRHLEILEFLLEVVGRTRTLSDAVAR
ncbi:MAG: methylthioribulose 1-phosphate dehydratase [Candidatus Sulfotelmatobacter sp.]